MVALSSASAGSDVRTQSKNFGLGEWDGVSRPTLLLPQHQAPFLNSHISAPSLLALFAGLMYNFLQIVLGGAYTPAQKPLLSRYRPLVVRAGLPSFFGLTRCLLCMSGRALTPVSP